MSAKVRKALFALVCLAQLAAPVSLIAKHEQTRANGSLWRFQTAPVDPDDPFRGRFVRLSFAVEREAVPFAETGFVYVAHGRRMYAELAAGHDGYARLVRLHEHRPSSVEYVDVFTREMRQQEEGEGSAPVAVFVRLPFDRYYLPEDVAPAVEREYAEASRKAQANTYVEVRVRDGHAALVGLVLDGKAAGVER
jgi:uncharacterized membrane-anchored protein